MVAKTTLLSLVGSAALASAASPNKPVISPAFPRGDLETGLRNGLSPTHSTWDYWGAGWTTQSCKSIALDHGLNPADFTLFNVHYDDCDESWIFCRHKDTGASEINMIDMFGRAPVHMRQYIRQFIATPGLHDGAAAFTYSNGDVVFEDAANMYNMLHEMSHSLDWHALPDYSSPFSGTSNWQNEYAKDSASVTGYAQTSWMENFAEVGPVAIYDKVVNGGVGNIQPNWNAVFHQYATYQGYLGDTILPGGTCTLRFQNSDVVPMSGSAKVRREDLGEKPDAEIKNPSIKIIAPKPEVEGQIAYTYE